MSMPAAERARTLVEWLKNENQKAGTKGAVVGLSGGIDSATVAGLCARAFPGETLGVIMPCNSNPQDGEHARLVAETFNIRCKTVHLDPVYDLFFSQLSAGEEVEPRGLAAANLKPRLRMATLYFHANLNRYLVVGTGNLSELTVGYFTKYGDGGVDLLPLGNLVKSDVRKLAAFLGVPQVIIDKPPSAGLWQGQTDEGEMGLTYRDLDHYILTGEASEAVKSKIENLKACSEHKKRLVPIAMV